MRKYNYIESLLEEANSDDTSSFSVSEGASDLKEYLLDNLSDFGIEEIEESDEEDVVGYDILFSDGTAVNISFYKDVDDDTFKMSIITDDEEEYTSTIPQSAVVEDTIDFNMLPTDFLVSVIQNIVDNSTKFEAKKKVIRGGKLVTVNVPTKRKKMSAKQKAAIRRGKQRMSGSDKKAAAKKRLKSMKLRRKKGL